eukprot:5369890-Prymnesium_polylepis.2
MSPTPPQPHTTSAPHHLSPTTTTSVTSVSPTPPQPHTTSAPQSPPVTSAPQSPPVTSAPHHLSPTPPEPPLPRATTDTHRPSGGVYRSVAFGTRRAHRKQESHLLRSAGDHHVPVPFSAYRQAR